MKLNRDSEKILRMQACPMNASVHWDPKDDNQSDIEGWLRIYNKLPYQIRLGLVDQETEQQILQLAKQFEIYRVGEVGELSRILRDSFVSGVFEKETLEQRIVEKLKLDKQKAEQLLSELFGLRKKISGIAEDSQELKLENLPIIPALKKFPQLNKQLLGEQKIKLKGEQEFKKPTIKNWLDDYTLQKGAQAHNNLERSDYIFNSSNAARLSFVEKKALSLLLESYDEDSDLTVDITRNLILFDALEDRQLEGLRETLQKEGVETEEEIKKEQVLEEIPATGIEQVEIAETETESKEEVRQEEHQKPIQQEDKPKSKHIINLKDI